MNFSGKVNFQIAVMKAHSDSTNTEHYVVGISVGARCNTG